MGLDEIAAGLETVTEQEERGVATVDATGESVTDRLRPHADALPCPVEAAAALLEAYARGVPLDDAATEAGLPAATAATALHRCGVAGVSPLPPDEREPVRRWLAGELSWTVAADRAGLADGPFALAAYVEEFEPEPELVTAAAPTLGSGERSTDGRDATRDAVASPDDLR